MGNNANPIPSISKELMTKGRESGGRGRVDAYLSNEWVCHSCNNKSKNSNERLKNKNKLLTKCCNINTQLYNFTTKC